MTDFHDPELEINYGGDMPEEDADEAPQGIPPFKWVHPKTGKEGWVSFNDPDDLTGRDIQSLRNTITDSGSGMIANAFMTVALELLVAEWEVPMPAGKPSPIIPRLDRSRKVLGTVPGKFLIALEKHVRPHLDFIKDAYKVEEGEPGSPPQPARG